MWDKICVFYYPEFTAELPTIKKAILLFDEIHFIDRPSFMFHNFGTVGCASPVRQFDKVFRENGVELYVHSVPDGPVHGELLEEITADVNDPEFLRRFQDGLRKSELFRAIQISPGNYGEAGDHTAVVAKLLSVDLERDLPAGITPMDWLMDRTAEKPFDFSSALGTARTLVMKSAFCSTKLNVALSLAKTKGMTPFADATPYGELLGVKYKRAMRMASQQEGWNVELTDLTFAVVDELVPAERLAKLAISDVIRYRKEAAGEREAFLERLAVLHSKQAGVTNQEDYQTAIRSIVLSGIVPAAREYKNRLAKIYDDLFGSLAQSTFQYVGGSAVLELFGHLGWATLLPLAVLAAGKLGAEAVKAKNRPAGCEARMCAFLRPRFGKISLGDFRAGGSSPTDEGTSPDSNGHNFAPGCMLV
jgi:hypothetical protein